MFISLFSCHELSQTFMFTFLSPQKPPKLAEIDSDEELLKSEIRVESRSQSPSRSQFDNIFAKKESPIKSSAKVSKPFKKVTSNGQQKTMLNFFKKK